uniref:Reverse transcriptase n=1 Tax=Cacopsylla melanoneura TaxID=428564 RepID=A0A8D8Q0G5_9HEMI
MTTEPINIDANIRKSELWRHAVTQPLFDLKEEPPPGSNLPYPTWKSLNRLRSGVSRCKANLRRWGYTDDATCECGEIQTHAHLLTCTELEHACTQDDLAQANERAIQTARFWEKKI